MFIRTQTTDRTYLMLVENERVEGRLVQRVLHRFGRLDELQASGQIDAILRSLGRFGDKLVVLDAHAKGLTTETSTRCVGPALIPSGCGRYAASETPCWGSSQRGASIVRSNGPSF